MRKGDIDRFFREVAKEIKNPIRIFITGGVASWFMGGSRPTGDIDFGLRVKGKGRGGLHEIFGSVSRKLGIAVEFSEDIGRWGMIDLPNYEKRAVFYKQFGRVSISILDIGSWSIGKLCRYYASDVSDLVAVFKKQKPDLRRLIRLWAQALKKSPRSSEQFLFVKNIEDFLGEYGPNIWGRRFQKEKMIALFQHDVQSRH